MGFPTILILGLFSLGVPFITCGFAPHASEVSNISGENETNIIPYGHETLNIPGGIFLPRGSITELTYRGKVIIKQFTCPAIYGRYPHPQSCEYYFECRFGIPTLWHCNRGYLYDSKREQCRDRRNVKCHIGHDRDNNHHRDEKDKEIDVKEDVGYFKCPYIWGTFAHPSDCSKYYVCVYNYPKLFQCNQNFLYDTQYRRCLPRNKVNCGDRLDRDQMRTSRRPVALTTTVRPVDITTVTSKDSNFYCPFPYGRYPDPEDCSRYYECRFSVPHIYNCPESTLYDERNEQCLEKKRVKCGGRPGGNDEGVESEDDKNVNFRCPYVWGTFAHPVDCSKYIVCIYNVPSIFNCRKNELFDSYHRRCFPKEKVSCGDRINPDDPYSIKTTAYPKFSTMGKLPNSTPVPRTATPIRISTPVPTTVTPTRISTPVPTTATPTRISTPVPTTGTPTRISTPVPTTATPTRISTPVPTTVTPTRISTLVPTTATPIRISTPVPITATPTRISTPVSTTAIPTKISTPVPTTRRATTTPTPLTTTISPKSSSIDQFSTIIPVMKPNTPPPTDCDEDDLDCIIDGTGDVTGWFDCPKRYGHFPHGSSQQLFIHCDNWRPFVKTCAEHTRFSPVYLVCVWENKNQTKL